MNQLIVRIDRSTALAQFVPLVLTVIVFGALWGLLFVAVNFFNLNTKIRSIDIIIGATIYLKTSIDFAIFMGRLMAANPGWRSRVAIEIGTAAGNAMGTILIISLWVVFRHVDILLALMVFLASLVLFELAHGSLEHVTNEKLAKPLHAFLDVIKRATDPILSRIMPDLGAKLRGQSGLSWGKLLTFSAGVPFILGLDDFAGYVPLFNVVNVYGFAIGVIGAHTILNIFLFLSPRRTIEAVKNQWISFLGTLAFIGLGFYGIAETLRILGESFH